MPSMRPSCTIMHNQCCEQNPCSGPRGSVEFDTTRQSSPRVVARPTEGARLTDICASSPWWLCVSGWDGITRSCSCCRICRWLDLEFHKPRRFSHMLAMPGYHASPIRLSSIANFLLVMVAGLPIVLAICKGVLSSGVKKGFSINWMYAVCTALKAGLRSASLSPTIG